MHQKLLSNISDLPKESRLMIIKGRISCSMTNLIKIHLSLNIQEIQLI